ncbi:MAG: amino acid adenylation domain-containing protein [Ferruginibacter sp.]
MRKAILPLHPAQQDVYTDQLINAKSPHYNIGGYVKLIGSFSAKRFHEVINSTHEVFDAFRLRFDLETTEPLCYFDRGYEKSQIPEIDFSTHGNPADEALSWMQNRFNKPLLILENALPFEEYLLRIADNEYWFFGKYHHLITDGYGFTVFLKYVAQKYKSLSEGEDVVFSFPSYAEEISSAAAYFSSADFAQDKIYWKNKIASIPKKILSVKYNESDEAGKTSGNYLIDITPAQFSSIKALQELTGSGIHQATIAALLIYFGKTTDHTDFVFGIPVHKRASRKLRNIVGMFSGVLPFKGSFENEKKLSGLLKEINVAQKGDYRHHNYPVGDLSRELKASSSGGYLYQVSVDYEPLNFELDFGVGMQSNMQRLSNDFDRNPLQLCWLQYGKQGSLQLQVHYGKAFFNQQEIELFAERLIFIINQFPSALDKRIGEIEVLLPGEKKLLENFNNNAVTYPNHQSIIDLFETQVAKTPNSIALVFGNAHFTYQQLNDYSNRLGHFLVSKGVGENTLVPLCINRSSEMIIGILGILKAGGAYVPVDPEYPAERINFMLEDTNATIIVCDTDCAHKLPVTGNVADLVLLDRDWPKIIHQSSKNVGVKIKSNQLAYLIYTSGSTGKPKGVMIEHGGVVNLITGQSTCFNISSSERIIQFSNYCFDASVEQVFLALFNGASLIMFAEGLQLNPAKFESFLNENRITHLHATPGFLANLQPAKIKTLKRVIAGGDLCKKELAKHWSDTVDFYNEYGPTETTVTAVEYQYQIGQPEHTATLPIGKPIANTRLYIVGKNMALVPVGVAGELYIAGAGVARGYLNRPELTAEKFIADSFTATPGAKMYATGDLARWLPDGNLEFLGRIDEQVKIRGYRVELGEIENVLQQFEAVKQAVVLAREDKSGNKLLTGFIVPEGLFNRDAILLYLKKKLPEYMIPAIWVQLEKLPLTSNGKIDRKALNYPDAEGILSSEYEAPSNELESEIASIWKEILNLERVGANDNFFELGGHSLNAMQVASRLHKMLSIKTDIGTIFSNPTVRQLSDVLAKKTKDQFVGIKRLPLQDYYPLSHAQKRFWILSHFKNGSEAYNVSNAFIIEGSLNKFAFKQAVDAVIERHEILRTVFIEVEGEPIQKILTSKALQFAIEEINLQDIDDPEVAIRNRLEEAARNAFDLSRGPLLRATIFQLETQKFILVFSIHHIISDGWSKGILIREILQFYRVFCGDAVNHPTPLPLQYKDYAAWHTSSFQIQGNYWRALYKNSVPVLSFPTDFERPKVLTFFGAMVQTTLSEMLTEELQKKANEHNTSLNNLLFAVYGMLVARISGQEEVVIGSLSSGRSHIDLENLVGVFINFLPIRLSPVKDLKVSEYLSNSHNNLTGAYNNQDYPFDLMVADCIEQRDVSRNPFFDTMVNFHLENGLQGKVDFGDDPLTDSTIKIKPYKSIQKDLYQSVLDFKLDIEPAEDKLHFYLSYNSKLFKKETMISFLNQFLELLEFIVKEPGKHLGEYGDWKDNNTSLTNKEGIAANNSNQSLALNIAASFVVEPMQEYIEYWSNEFELDVEVSFAPYNQVFQQLINPNSLLNTGTGINVLFIRIEDWLRDQGKSTASEQVTLLNEAYSAFVDAIENINRLSVVPFLFGLVPQYEAPNRPQIVATHINHLNAQLEIFIKEQPRFHLLDLEKIASLYAVELQYDAQSDALGHMPFTPEFYAALGTYLARKVNAFKGLKYKVIALDCDNTLWKGVCGELGALEVSIDENFLALQQFILQKYKEGFLIVLCSKNNESDVWEVFERHPAMQIKREHIAAHRINWEPKAGNLLSISVELNLGLNSFIFLDDSEFEVEQMLLGCPDVLSVQLPLETNDFKNFLDHIWAFDYFKVTDEDGKRNIMYQVEKQRKDEQVNYDSLEHFLDSLDIKINISALTYKELERAVQLSIRTNQFNLNGIRKTAAELAELIHNDNSLKWIVEVKDRFGDYGIVGLVLANEQGESLIVETFLLSCRVLGRNVEDNIVSELEKVCEVSGIKKMSVMYQETVKNKPFLEFLTRTEWVLDIETGAFSRQLKINEQITA